jgi:hypothetical protein
MADVSPRTVSNTRLLLGVMYEMSAGKAGVALDRLAVFERCKELAIFDWTEEKFEEWRLETVARFKGAADG